MKKIFLLSFWINFAISQIGLGALRYREKGKFLILPSLVAQIKDIPLFINLPGKEKPYPTFTVELPDGRKTKAILLHHTVIFWGSRSPKKENLEKKITLTFKNKDKEHLFFEYSEYKERGNSSLSEEFSEVIGTRRTILIKLEHPKA